MTRMGLPAGFLLVLNALVTAAVSGGVYAWWLASRRRLSEETIGRATIEAERLVKQAEREAESMIKEAALSAREKAHDMATEADRQARERRQEILARN